MRYRKYQVKCVFVSPPLMGYNKLEGTFDVPHTDKHDKGSPESSIGLSAESLFACLAAAGEKVGIGKERY